MSFVTLYLNLNMKIYKPLSVLHNSGGGNDLPKADKPDYGDIGVAGDEFIKS